MTNNPENPIPTTERLAQALEATGDPKLARMIELARKGYYDDFKSELAFPLVQLATDLQAAGHPEMVRRVVDGEFDATLEESQTWFESEEGQAIFNELINPTPRRGKDRKKGK